MHTNILKFQVISSTTNDLHLSSYMMDKGSGAVKHFLARKMSEIVAA